MRHLSWMTLCLVVFCGSPVPAAGPQPPADWNKPKALAPANGEGQVSFQHGGKAITLPLQHISIDKEDDLFLVELRYVDAKQENRLEIFFGSSPRLGKNDPRTITGFTVNTKAGGLSRAAANKTKCVWAALEVKEREVSGALSCTGLTDMSSQKSAPDVTEVKFSGKLK
ncbi:MAG: hypothetical protein GYA21_10265 [Myxococcales bacterium]|nr:hypothetical protein [Myxococcales bacterium]